MSTSLLFSVAALAGSAVLVFMSQARLPALFAAAAAGLEVLLSTGVISMHRLGGFPLHLALGAVLLVAAVVAYLRVSSKMAVSAATVAALVGLFQVLTGLRG